MLNWIVGNTLHSFILTPYEAWRQSHKSHHSNTCNADKDEIFYPNPPPKHAALVTTLGGAWFFYILFSNVPGRRSYLVYFKTNEFRNSAPQLAISFASLFMVLSCIIQACRLFGCYTVFIFYGAPLFVFASWLVVVTFLHHHDEACTWYNNKSWTKLKGSLAAVDRDYGWLVNTLSHSINLHQIHHLFPIIQHYHLGEATHVLQDEFPHMYTARGGSNAVAFIKGVQKWINNL
jgi:omega-3 fatty acid desaturase (delta-15 desaturase)